MPGLLRFFKVPEGPASPLWWVARTPFALMQQCPQGAMPYTASQPRSWPALRMRGSVAGSAAGPGRTTDRPIGQVVRRALRVTRLRRRTRLRRVLTF